MADSDTDSHTANQMAKLYYVYYVELFTLHGVRFNPKCQLKEWDRNRDQNRNPDLGM